MVPVLLFSRLVKRIYSLFVVRLYSGHRILITTFSFAKFTGIWFFFNVKIRLDQSFGKKSVNGLFSSSIFGMCFFGAGDALLA